MPDITAADLIREVRRLAKEKPHNKYARLLGDISCRYNFGTCTDGSCGCWFGQALRNLGRPAIREGVGIRALLEEMDIPHTDEETSWCNTAQAEQDCGSTWSEALAKADANHGKIHPLEDEQP